MNKDAPVIKERAAQRPRGVVARTLAFTMGTAVTVVIAMGLSIGLEWTGILVGWWSSYHSVQLLTTERGFIEAIDTFPLLALEPVSLASHAGLKVDALARTVGFQASSGAYAFAAINTIKLVLLRLAICVFSVPAFVLVSLVALFDGLVMRDIRKYTGGHESSYVFHKAKRFVVPSVALTISVYLMLPVSIPPVLVFGPTLALTGAAIYTATSRFKKYL